MKIVFLHNNFPAQFGQFGLHLAAQGDEVWFGTARDIQSRDGIRIFNYKAHRSPTQGIHPYAVNFENAVLNGQAAARACLELKAKGLNPDVVMAHSGWGPGLFAKDVWPDAKYVGFFEWYYAQKGPDVEFMADPDRSLDDELRGRARNAAILMDFAESDGALCPTDFQKAQFPEKLRDRLTVLHDGVDAEILCARSGGARAPRRRENSRRCGTDYLCRARDGALSRVSNVYGGVGARVEIASARPCDHRWGGSGGLRPPTARGRQL